MKNKLWLILMSFIVINCGVAEKENLSEKAKDEITQTEKAFSEMSVTKGIKEAFLYYAADDAVKLTNRQHPSLGKDALRKLFEEDTDTSGTLQWYPVKADAAASGELGYTYGNWEYTGTDSTGKELKAYGNYFTVWKKDSDGKWKFELDGGNTTPQPINQ